MERNIKNLLTAAPLMPALEADAPHAEAEGGTALLTQYGRSGYTQLAGCFDADVQARHIYVLLLRDGESHCFEAFPILEERADSLAETMVSPRGFSLTLPEGLSGEYEAAVLADGVRYAAGTVLLANG